MKPFSIIVAVDEAGGIGRDGQLPWRLPGELKHFREITTGQGRNAVIMGRTTWLSIPERFRPLPERINIVLSRTPDIHLGAQIAESLEQALDLAISAEKVFVIGGASVYHLALTHPDCTEVLITRIKGEHACDTFFPAVPPEFIQRMATDSISEAGETYWYEQYLRR